MSDVLAITRALVQRPSITPDDAGCQSYLAERLSRLGFVCESMRFGDVDNLWAVHGKGAPVLCLAGHTDVVPTGPAGRWRCDPFDPLEQDGLLYGRGTADMKASIAAMIVACERFLRDAPGHSGTLALLITSDEEGPALDGTRRVVETLRERGQHIDWCLVGEPTSTSRLGDTLRIGRRGSLSGGVRIRGVQGHVAYPDLVTNPIHLSAPAFAELAGAHWDDGNEHFPPTSFQISNIASGTGADNVVPGELSARFNFRHSTALTPDDLKTRVAAILDAHSLDYTLDWLTPSIPYLSEPGPLAEAACDAVRSQTGLEPELNTRGGTSDGRFVATIGAEVVELGPINASIHKVDEHVRIADLEPLAEIYRAAMAGLLRRDASR